ncbi:hypothetical protein CR513_45170, partial [Mucuna pruriens]
RQNPSPHTSSPGKWNNSRKHMTHTNTLRLSMPRCSSVGERRPAMQDFSGLLDDTITDFEGFIKLFST